MFLRLYVGFYNTRQRALIGNRNARITIGRRLCHQFFRARCTAQKAEAGQAVKLRVEVGEVHGG